MVRRRPAEPVEHPADRLGEHLAQRLRVRRFPLEEAQGVLRERQRVAAGLAGLADELLQFRQRAIDLGQGRVGSQPEVDRPVPGLGRGHAHRALALRRSPRRSGTRRGAGFPRDRPQPLGPDRQLVDPQGLLVRQQAGPEVGREQELIELHVREIGRAEDHVRALHDELAVEPAAHDAVPIGPIPVGVQAVQLEHGLDAVPRVVGEQHVLAVVERAVVAAAEGALGQPVRPVLILDVLGRQAQLALLRFDVEGQMAGGRAVVFVVLGGQQVHQVGMIRAAGPSPPR